MNGPSRASEYYNQITRAADPIDFLNGLVTSKKPENNFLEFKGAQRISDKLIKEYWSKALSGFANTEGGVVIWGIKATRFTDLTNPARKVDCATDFDLVPEPSSLGQLLKDVRLEATSDPVAGVDICALDGNKGDGSGFVVCLVPESSLKPHRAQLHPDRQYYQRIGDSFTIIPHSLLRSLFYPRVQATFHIEANLSWGMADQQSQEIPRNAINLKLTANLTNGGAGTAKEVVFMMRNNVRALAEADIRMGNRWGSRLPSLSFFCLDSIHPGMYLRLLEGRWVIKGNVREDHRVVPDCDSPEFKFTFYAENQEPQVLTLRFDSEKLISEGLLSVEASPS